ncbi:bifunctional [glutamine synthetase] adenylyltransferase/[glutamine synthetase]-adenylyl-L-tyrosine phosphorylase [Arcanobacterium pinnipediorum]|uniref:Bifunctional [glutamine synthetase] adenylyltransferase/[glutamine synthetase]-adenylyl-L-tyrosine phosphorylase n=1 Tax=Arcanobacterium pinnipediorum TaxID=1503041 RepID=A0ABY5AIR1_9ACTO|nr:bifunctional [glutamine synthetase] adenylyltransferase/[glutamine synthetase]-adenylyl-L-tyrosine phosphorylase [Arcanobacterium pinnipediorum]USR80089.1 bifunctional [glutamine synthetase] adenylyltransferase/[glutamine synthetase]-adenylyl-L-tyrosine phosphorylase [Arcanobacterium pinnipediorum]
MDHIETLLNSAPDPTQAKLAYTRLREGIDPPNAKLLDQITNNLQCAQRLAAILGFSTALSDLLIAAPHLLRAIDEPYNEKLSIDNSDDEGEFITSLRLEYYRHLIAIVAHDLTAPNPTDSLYDTSQLLSDLAGEVLKQALRGAQRWVEGGELIKFSIIGMGKTGARELNYVSDVDVIYIAEPKHADLPETEAMRIGSAIVTWITRAVSARGQIPPLWELDANLRPEGKNGPLVRTLVSHQAYYERWAQPWEFQALLKARPLAGDCELGQQYIDFVTPLVWGVANREGFVDDVRRMRERVVAHIPQAKAGRQLKLGAGGLRDIEFTVQLLQLVHGRTDESIRPAGTIDAIRKLSAAGYIGREAGAKLENHYRFLRALEHRIQLQRLRRTHDVPRVEQLDAIARTLGMTAHELEDRWLAVRREVRQLHTAIFYHPLLPSLASLDPDNVVLDEHAARARLAAIGFKNPDLALRNISVLTAGLSRTATIQRHVLPAMIGWMSQAVEPDHGLNAFRDVSQRLGTTSWYMRLLRDSALVAPRLAHVLATSRYLAQLLPSLPDAITWLDDDQQLRPRTAEELSIELSALLSRRKTAHDKALAGRYLRRREILRMALGQTLNVVSAHQVRRALSDAMDIAVSAALAGALHQGHRHARHCVIALGSLGGGEIGYASDADLIFVYDPLPGSTPEAAGDEAQQVASSTLQLLKVAGREPPVNVDTTLRPEGKQGALTRSLSSYQSYYERWAQTWEQQALLRARFCAGDRDLGDQWFDIINPIRYPNTGLTPGQLREIRMLKIRMERERLPRGADPTRHIKLGRGGISDVEWTVQLCQLQHGAHHWQLRTPSTMAALDAAEEEGFILPADAEILRSAWTLGHVIRDLNVLGTAKTGASIDLVPDDPVLLRLHAALNGTALATSQEITESYLRSSRRARAVMEQYFYGEKSS